MPAERVRYVYTAGDREGREVEVGVAAVQALVDAGAPIRVLEGEEYLSGYEPPPDKAGEEEARDGWPPGYVWERTGAYYDVRAPDGSRITSEGPSGKWRGEDAGQEAAWRHYTEAED